MTLRGHIKDGKVVVDDKIDLPNGTEVDISLSERAEPSGKRRKPSTGAASKAEKPATKRGRSSKSPTPLDRYSAIVGTAKDLPKDLAEQHDHYARGTRKRR
jgi:hypothetical protein